MLKLESRTLCVSGPGIHLEQLDCWRRTLFAANCCCLLCKLAIDALLQTKWRCLTVLRCLPSSSIRVRQEMEHQLECIADSDESIRDSGYTRLQFWQS